MTHTPTSHEHMIACFKRTLQRGDQLKKKSSWWLIEELEKALERIKLLETALKKSEKLNSELEQDLKNYTTELKEKINELF